MIEHATPVDPYQEIAALYDLEHDDFQDDIDLLSSLADTCDGPILELGSGTGRIVVPLAGTGRHVIGLDTSPVMLERARSRIESAGVEAQVDLVRGDMRDATAVPGGPFGMIVFSLNGLMHLADPHMQVETLANASRALRPDGIVVIDIANPTPDYLSQLVAAPALEGSWQLPDGSTVDKSAWRTIDPVTQVIDTLIWYDQVKPGGGLVRHRTRFDLRYIHSNELALMLQLAGFTTISMHGSYELEPLGAESDRIIAIAGFDDAILPDHDEHGQPDFIEGTT